MSRRAMLALLAVVAVAIGVPVGIAALGGDDDAPTSGTRTHFPEGIDADSVPEEQQRPSSAGADEARDAKRRGRGGPPQHAKAFDRTMEGVDYPNAITASGAQAVRAVERAAGAEVEEGQQTVIGADCRRGTCSVRYRTGPRGTGRIVSTQVRIVRRLFSDPDVRRVVLYVHHKTVGRKKEERPAFIVVTCTRRPGLVWSRITARQLSNRCKVVDQAGGKLRNNVRRGQLSVGEASRGAEAEGGGGGGPASAPGLKPSGTPAPKNVNGKAPEKEGR